MEKKKCSKCGIEKEISEFWKRKGKTRSECIVCVKSYYSEHAEELKKHRDEVRKKLKETDPCRYYAESTWKTLNQRCVNGLYANSKAIKNSPQMVSYHGKGILLCITKDELAQFWRDNEVLVKTILTSGGIPSIDRIDSNLHYSLDNMQIMERNENMRKSRGFSERPKRRTKESIRIKNSQMYRNAQSRQVSE